MTINHKNISKYKNLHSSQQLFKIRYCFQQYFQSVVWFLKDTLFILISTRISFCATVFQNNFLVLLFVHQESNFTQGQTDVSGCVGKSEQNCNFTKIKWTLFPNKIKKRIPILQWQQLLHYQFQYLSHVFCL